MDSVKWFLPIDHLIYGQLSEKNEMVHLIQCFALNLTLRELYLHSPPSTLPLSSLLSIPLLNVADRCADTQR